MLDDLDYIVNHVQKRLQIEPNLASMARDTGLSRSAIWKLKVGLLKTSEMKLSTLRKLVKYFDIADDTGKY